MRFWAQLREDGGVLNDKGLPAAALVLYARWGRIKRPAERSVFNVQPDPVRFGKHHATLTEIRSYGLTANLVILYEVGKHVLCQKLWNCAALVKPPFPQ